MMEEPPKTILVVDDDPEVRELAIAVLEAEGYHVLEAGSGDEALHFLAGHPDLRVDALFTDIVMPGRLDGIDLAEAAHVLRPDLPILFATGFANLARRDRDPESRGPVLRKPYRPGDLRRALLVLIDDPVD